MQKWYILAEHFKPTFSHMSLRTRIARAPPVHLCYTGRCPGPEGLVACAYREGGVVEFRDRRFVIQRHYEAKQLWDHHNEMIRRSILGQSNIEIAAAMGMTPQQVSNVLNSTLAREKAAALGAEADERVVDIAERIRAFTPRALTVLEEIIEGKGEFEGASAALRGKHAEQYVARGGYGAIQKVHSMSLHATREDIESFKQRQRESAIDQGVIAVNYTEHESA
jgi:hypothetical protein